MRAKHPARHINTVTSTVAIWVQLQSILCQTRLSRSFVIFNIRALLSHERQSWCQKLQMTGLPWSGMGCFIAVPLMATVGVKGLKNKTSEGQPCSSCWLTCLITGFGCQCLRGYSSELLRWLLTASEVPGLPTLAAQLLIILAVPARPRTMIFMN